VLSCCRQPPTSSTSCLPRRYRIPHRTSPSSARHPLMIICVSSVANVIQTCQQPLPTNSLLGLHCVFLGYSAHHKGYRCLDLSSNRLIISRHIIFDESSFPYAEHGCSPSAVDFEFFDATDFVPAPICVAPKFSSAGPSSAQPCAAAPGVDPAGSAAPDALLAGPSSSDAPSHVLGVAS